MEQFYQVIIGQHRLYPFEGFPTGLIHKTLEGAWSEVGDILEGLFQEYYLSTLRFEDINVNIPGRQVFVSYERTGFSTQTQTVYSMTIEPVVVVK